MEKLDTKLSHFYEILSQTIENTWEHEKEDAFLEAMTQHSNVLYTEIKKLGDYCFQQLQSQTSKDSQPHLSFFLINYSWGAFSKSFLILWRDILFQYQKGKILALNCQFEEDVLKDLKERSYQTLHDAAKELVEFVETETQRIRGQKGGSTKQIARWQLQQNPWPTFKDQMETIPHQCQNLVQQYGKLKEVSSKFQTIGQLIDQTLNSSHQELEEARSLAQKSINFIEEHFENNLRKISVQLKEQEDDIIPKNYAGQFGYDLEEILEVLSEKMQIPFQTSGGIIQFKEINFQRASRLWLESEILPILYEIWELNTSINNGLKMSFVNIRNRILLLTNEKQEGIASEGDKETIYQPLKAFINKTKATEEELSKLTTLIRERLEVDFQIPAIYDSQQFFLPIPLQSTLNQFKLNQNEFLLKVKNWFYKQLGFIQRVKTALEREEALSTSEKIVRFIESRKGDQANHQFTSIFLTKGYIGESFWVGREKELQHMEKLIDQWKTGFRGAVMLSGRRFSGKSLFGELIANRFFTHNTIRLSPNTTIHIQGRRFSTTYDLEEALEFIQKYTINAPMLIWIDDLELWGDAHFSLNQNLRTLYRYIDSYSRRLFFLVATSQWKKAQLTLLHDVNKVFQATINLDKMSPEEIREAILIRHGATHKTLVNEDGEEVSPQQFKKMTNKVIKISRNNVGEALNLWALSTKKVDEERVSQPSISNHVLPDFITPENALLLRSLIIEKRMNEYRLRKQFGPAFKEKYSGILQRLISIGLLTRHLDGWLEINDAVANDIGLLLEQKKYLL